MLGRMSLAVAFVSLWGTPAMAQSPDSRVPCPASEPAWLGHVFADETCNAGNVAVACVPLCQDICCGGVDQAIMTPSVVLLPACGCQQVLYLSQTTPEGNLLPVYSGTTFTTGPMQTWQFVPLTGNTLPQFRPVPPVNGYPTQGRIFPARRGTWFPLRGRRVR